MAGNLVSSMQLSLFYKLESLLCCTQFLKWRLCPLWAQDLTEGLGLGLDWKELTVVATGCPAWHLPSLEQRGGWTTQ